jgi:hypothetical protein
MIFTVTVNLIRWHAKTKATPHLPVFDVSAITASLACTREE